MAIPDYQALMLPLLKLASDGGEHTNAEAAEKLASELNLAEEDRRQMLPSGQAKFSNRIGWARTYMGKAGLLESAGRARFKITKRGRDLLAKNPQTITNQVLDQYPEFREFRERSPQADRATPTPHGESEQTPEELLASTYQTIRRSLADDLLKRIGELPPSFFESLVVDLLVAMGYGGSRRDAGQALGGTGDGGVDGLIKEDKLGLDVVYVQAKRWKNNNTVGRPEVQAFAGSLEGHRARRGVFITTSKFTQDAIAYTQRIEKKIILFNGEELAQLMIDHNVGVSEVATFRRPCLATARTGRSARSIVAALIFSNRSRTAESRRRCPFRSIDSTNVASTAFNRLPQIRSAASQMMVSAVITASSYTRFATPEAATLTLRSLLNTRIACFRW